MPPAPPSSPLFPYTTLFRSYRDEGRHAACPGRLAARRLEDIELVLDRELGVDHRLPALDAGEQRRQAMIALRPDHEIDRSEEHTSELQSRFDLVCRLLLEKK